jgi:hypothetical protein
MKILFIILSLQIFSQFSLAQSVEDMLGADSGPAVSASPAKKMGSESVLISTIQKIVGTKNTEFNIVYRAIESGDWAQAVIQYPKVFEAHNFYNTTNGQAVLAILEFHAGLKIIALENLFKISNPKDMNPVFQKYLTGLISVEDPAWSMARIKWSQPWSVVFAPSVQVWIESLSFDAKSIDELVKISSTLDENTKEKSFVDWHLAIKYSLTDKSEKAAQLLTLIRKNPNSYISPDLVQLTAARILFQNSYYDTAIKQYEKVSKNSMYWSQAQEEIGWSYVRKGQPHNAIAIGQSLIHPGLAKQVSSESFFMMSLAQLKICDYPSVIATLSEYSKNFKEKNQILKTLVSSTEDQNIEKFFKATAQVGSKSETKLGAVATKLPAQIALDRKLNLLIQKQTALQKESDLAEVLYAKSLALTGLQGHFETLKKNTLARVHAAQSESVTRIKFLATNEMENIKNNLDKLHIVEAEVISQVSIADQIAAKSKDDGSAKVGSTGSKSKDAVTFPLEKEVWFDEISTYKVNVKKACVAKATAKDKTL